MEKIKSDVTNENYILEYSPRTTFSMELEDEEKLYAELKLNFDPITIKIVKKHFKEHLGVLSLTDFVAILKNHLLGFLPNHPNREDILIRLLNRLFSDVDLNDNGKMEWNEFTNYIIHNTKTDNRVGEGEYSLRYYSQSPNNIKCSEITEMVTFSFYIEKYNVIGIVQEGKSTIYFFDAKKCKKLKCFIDLKNVQKIIDKTEFQNLDKRAEKNLEKEEEVRKIQREKIEQNNKNENNQTETKFNRGDRRKSVMNFYSEKDDKKGGKQKTKNMQEDEEMLKKSTNKKLSILCACFVPELDIILVSGTNNAITAWHFDGAEITNVNAMNDYQLFKEELRVAILIADNPQYSMIWDPQLHNLYTGQQDGKILKWELTKPTCLPEDVFDIKHVKSANENKKKEKRTLVELEEEKKLKEKLKQKSIKHHEGDVVSNADYHNETVSCLLLLKKLQLLAASYYNGYVVLWDTLLRDYRKCYCDQTTGIYSMAFDSTKNLIFTCGFTHEICVYDPYIDGGAVYKLVGHSKSINNLDIHEKDSELISLDLLGNIKVWDTKTFENFQTIKLKEEDNEEGSKKALRQLENNKKEKLSSNIHMLYIKKLKKIFVYGTKLMFYETDRNACPDLADDQMIYASIYDHLSKSVYSFCMRKIKIWNILTGKIKQVYNDPLGNECTAVKVDKHVKRGYLGDNTGRIININLRTGDFIKELTSHKTEIKYLCHSMKLNIVVSCSIDNEIKIHDDTELLETEVLRVIKIPSFQVRALCIVERFSRLGIGLSNGIVKFYDLDHFHFDSDLISDNLNIKAEVCSLLPLPDIELCVVFFSEGFGKILITPPSSAKFQSVYQFENIYDNSSFKKKKSESEKNKYNKKHDEKDKNRLTITVQQDEKIYTQVTCMEIDEKNKRFFSGDNHGNIVIYDIKQIYEIGEEMIKFNKQQLIDEKKDKIFDKEFDTIVTKDNFHLYDSLYIHCEYIIRAHNETIRHIHFVDIDPPIIITTSQDLRMRIFDVKVNDSKEDIKRECIDEFKQSNCKYKSIPTGIKFYLINPFSGIEAQKTESNAEHYTRKAIENFQLGLNEDNDYQQISEYSKKITEYNAKEKLWQNCKNVKVDDETKSNNWKLNINVDKLKETEKEIFNILKKDVKEREDIIIRTEQILQEKSIYNEDYKPIYIQEMRGEAEIKELNKIVSERLRNVKLAVSKANLNYTKMKDVSKKNIDDGKEKKGFYINTRNFNELAKSKSTADIMGNSSRNININNNDESLQNSNTTNNIFSAKKKNLPKIKNEPMLNLKNIPQTTKNEGALGKTLTDFINLKLKDESEPFDIEKPSNRINLAKMEQEYSRNIIKEIINKYNNDYISVYKPKGGKVIPKNKGERVALDLAKQEVTKMKIKELIEKYNNYTSRYKVKKTILNSVEDYLGLYKKEFKSDYSQIFSPFKMLLNKAKERKKSAPQKEANKDDEVEKDDEEESRLLRRKEMVLKLQRLENDL